MRYWKEGPGGRGPTPAPCASPFPPADTPKALPNSPKCLICLSCLSTKVLCFCSLTSSGSSSACSGFVLTMLCGGVRGGVGWGEAEESLAPGRVGRGRSAHPIHGAGGDGAMNISVAGA